MIEVLRAPAFAAVQDGGRVGHRAAGVPSGGALDSFALRCGNALLGNSLDAAGVELALTGGAFRFGRAAYVALTGARIEARLDGVSISSDEVVAASAGSELVIERVVRGRVAYLCVAGGIDVPVVLGGRGTYLPGAFGGLDGRLLRAGDTLPVGAPAAQARVGARLPAEVADRDDSARPIAVLRGPQADTLSANQWNAILGRELMIDPRSDRTGFRLKGSGLAGGRQPDGHSEPACPGAVQLTPDGTLIVLMPDGPTVGGYPKIAVVATADQSRLAQSEAGAQVSLQVVDEDRALAELRAEEALLRRI